LVKNAYSADKKNKNLEAWISILTGFNKQEGGDEL